MRIHTSQGEVQLSVQAGQRRMRRFASHWPLPVVQHQREDLQFTLGFQRGQDAVVLRRYAIVVANPADIDPMLGEVLSGCRQTLVQFTDTVADGLVLPCPFVDQSDPNRTLIGVALMVVLPETSAVDSTQIMDRFIEIFQTSDSGASLPGFEQVQWLQSASIGVMKLEMALVDGEMLLLALTEPTGVFPPDIIDCLGLLARSGLRHIPWAPSAAAVLALDVVLDTVEPLSVEDSTDSSESKSQTQAHRGPVGNPPVAPAGPPQQAPPTAVDEIREQSLSDDDAGKAVEANSTRRWSADDEQQAVLQAEAQSVETVKASNSLDSPLSVESSPGPPFRRRAGWTFERLPTATHAPNRQRESQPLPLGRPTQPLFTAVQDHREGDEMPPLVAVVGADHDFDDGAAPQGGSESLGLQADLDADRPLFIPAGEPEPLSMAESQALRASLDRLRSNPLFRLVRASWNAGIAQLIATAVDACVRAGRLDALPASLGLVDDEISVIDGFAGMELLLRGGDTTGLKVCIGSGYSTDELENLVPIVGAGCSQLVAVTFEDRAPPVGWHVVPLSGFASMWVTAAETAEHSSLMLAAGELCTALVEAFETLDQMSDEQRLLEREALRDAGMLGMVRRQIALECREEIDAQLDTRLTRAQLPHDLRPEEVSLELDQRGADLTLRVRLGATWGEWGVWLRGRRVELLMICTDADAEARWNALLQAAELTGAQTRVRGTTRVVRADRFDWLARGTRDELIALIARLVERGVQAMREYALG